MKYYKTIRVVFVLVPVLVFGYFSYKYVNPSGVLEFEYDFCRETTPYVSGLTPKGRVLDIEKTKTRCEQRMVIDPVYFDVRLPQSYRKVILDTEVEKSVEQKLRIGVGVNPDNWKWEFGENMKTSENENIKTRTYRTTIDLTDAKFENNRYRFIISAPGLDISGESIVFRGLKFKFEKPPLTAENFISRIRSLMNM